MIYPQTFEEKIGMTEVRAMLKQHCLSTMGQERVDAVAFSTDAAELRERLQQVGEFARMQEETDGFPEQGYYDLRPTLARIRIEGTYLEVEELAQLKRSLETILAIRAMLMPHADEAAIPYPALSRMVAARTASSDGRSQGAALLIRRIDGVLDKFGHVKDSASPELARIRRELAATEGSIGRVLNGILRAAQAEGTVAADVAPTVRDGRLVIPVAPALKRKLKGIVHDESATGKTVFIEPTEVVEANNRIRELEAEEQREVIRILREVTDSLRELEADERREVIRILRELTEAVRPLCPELLESYEMLADMELVRAKALLAHEIGAPTTTEPQIAAHPLIDWTLAVHPLLQRSLARHGKGVVPLDIELTRRQRILLISGPNAGGTEPQIGGAMAEAVLQRFVRQGAFGIITTHYQNLKHFAEETEGVANGAMLYDRQLMQPLFQLQIGQPGSSFAVEIARKIGIPEEVIADASDIVGRDYINADKWLQDIVRDRRYWQQKRDAIHGQERQMQQTIEHYESEMGELRQQRKEILRRAREEAERLLQEANARIERTIREIREAQAENAARAAEEAVRAREEAEAEFELTKADLTKENIFFVKGKYLARAWSGYTSTKRSGNEYAQEGDGWRGDPHEFKGREVPW